MKTMLAFAAFVLSLSVAPATALVFEVAPSYTGGGDGGFGQSMGLWTQWNDDLDLGISTGYHGWSNHSDLGGPVMTYNRDYVRLTTQARLALPTPVISTFLIGGMGVYRENFTVSSTAYSEEEIGSYHSEEFETVAPGFNFGVGVDLPSFHPAVRISAEGTMHHLVGGGGYTTISMALGVAR